MALGAVLLAATLGFPSVELVDVPGSLGIVSVAVCFAVKDVFRVGAYERVASNRAGVRLGTGDVLLREYPAPSVEQAEPAPPADTRGIP